MMISVHLPKTAGTSFAAALEHNFGAALYRDYNDIPLNIPPYERNKAALQNCLLNAEKDFEGTRCIHGHFLPLKYLLLSFRRNLTFVTWMRNPVERVISHYYFWQKSFNPENAPALHRRMVEEEWSLERFCLGPEVKNPYSQYMFGFSLDYFSFIGITEFYDEDFAFFLENFMDDTSIEPQRLNIGSTEGKGYGIPNPLRIEIERHHALDMKLYQRALAMRQERQPR